MFWTIKILITIQFIIMVQSGSHSEYCNLLNPCRSNLKLICSSFQCVCDNSFVWMDDKCAIAPTNLYDEFSNGKLKPNTFFDKLYSISLLNKWNLDDLKNFLKSDSYLKSLKFSKMLSRTNIDLRLNNEEILNILSDLKSIADLEIQASIGEHFSFLNTLRPEWLNSKTLSHMLSVFRINLDFFKAICEKNCLHDSNIDEVLKYFIILNNNTENVLGVKTIITLLSEFGTDSFHLKNVLSVLKSLVKITQIQSNSNFLINLLNDLLEKKLWTPYNLRNLLQKVTDLLNLYPNSDPIQLINIFSGIPISNPEITQESTVASIPIAKKGLIDNILDVFGLSDLLISILDTPLKLDRHLKQLASLFNRQNINVMNSIFNGKCNTYVACNNVLKLDCVQNNCIEIEII
ncbi:unnamed protein product [Brachionus calyciflorus]|uniref:Uncharacterized protein n=1 Tax=Brachionus calyciflorus TaxID=104777 RepID=A0A814EUP8_9BILA|nr:unnamed protein product [Brachionus calyciflorus]